MPVVASLILAACLMQTVDRATDTITYRAEVPRLVWEGWDDEIPPYRATNPPPIPEHFEIVPRTGNTPRTFSGKVVLDGPVAGAQVGLVSLVGIHWNNPNGYQWIPVRADGSFRLVDDRDLDALKAFLVRGPHTAWTFLRYNFRPEEGAKDIVLKAAPSRRVSLTATGPDGTDLAHVVYEPFNAHTQYDDHGSDLCRQRDGYFESGDDSRVDLVLPAGQVAIFVHHPGLADDYQVVDTTLAHHIHFVLRKAGGLKITVLDQTGQPRGNVGIQWVNRAAPLSLCQFQTRGTGIVDADHLVPGMFKLDVEGFRSRAVQVEEGHTTEVVFQDGKGN